MNYTDTAKIVDVKTGERTKTVEVGAEVLHFNPSTGRVVRVVKILDFKGESATVETVNGPDRGKVYPVALSKLGD